MSRLKTDDMKTIADTLDPIINDSHVQEMKKYIQHGKVSTFDHCESVALASYSLNRKLHLKANEETLLKGAILHDFYLYDWHEKDNGSHDWHGFIHPGRAVTNARKYLKVEDDVASVIDSHMWPLTITKIPKSREAWIVCIADKYVSLKETLYL